MPYLNPEDKVKVKIEGSTKRSNLPSQCIKCGYISQNGQDLINHIELFHKVQAKTTYACPNCKYATAKYSNLELHIKKVHEDIRKCNWCTYQGIREQLKQHVIEVHKSTKATCKFCDYSSSVKVHMRQHVNSIHDRVLGESCDQCDYRCSRKGLLKEHKEYAHEKDKHHQCPICTYKVNRPKDLHNHIRHVHLKEPYKRTRFPCSQCSFSASKPQIVRKHLYLEHHQLLVCEWCSFTTKSKEELKQHEISIHSDHIRQCKHCNYTTSRSIEYLHHVKSVHEKKREAVCVICKKCFSRKSSLYEHFKKAHEQIYDVFCDICGFSCATKRQLYDHKRAVHVKKNDKPKVWRTSCKECSFSATKSSIVKKHLYLEHLQVHVCEWCTFTANDKDDITKHEKVAHFENFNICHICNYSTRSSHNLSMHLKSVHEKKIEQKTCEDSEEVEAEKIDPLST